MRTLVIMRHAKAESSAPSDFERELVRSGHRDAAAAGRWLAAQGDAPDLALVSAATRTQQTWEDVALGAGWDLALGTREEALYAASTESALDILRGIDPAHERLLVIGHNPTVSSLVQLLDDGSGDEEAGNQLALGYPTAAATVLSYDGDWSELGQATAAVRAFHVARADD